MITRISIYDDGSAILYIDEQMFMTSWKAIGKLATQCEQQLQDFDIRKRKEQHAKEQA